MYSFINAVEKWLFNDVSDWFLAMKSCSLSWVLRSITVWTSETNPLEAPTSPQSWVSKMKIDSTEEMVFEGSGRDVSINLLSLNQLKNIRVRYRVKYTFIHFNADILKYKLSILVQFCFQSMESCHIPRSSFSYCILH